MRMHFDRSGASVGSGATTLALGVRAVGYGSALHALGDGSPRAKANAVFYRPAPYLSEWYFNGPGGLEQGFTVSRAPADGQTGPLTLAMTLSDDARPHIAPDGQSLTLRGRDATPLRYGGLTASDALGRGLPSWLELRGRRLLLRVDVRGARFPVTIDPFLQQGPKLVGAGESPGGAFGFSVSLSGDGNTALVGAPEDSGGVGAAWVFTRSGATWTQQAVLHGGEEIEKGEFGKRVTLSSDGGTALVGGPKDGHGSGAAWVFVRSGSSWTQQAKLTGTEEAGKSEFGTAVALSADGNTALIGGPEDAFAAGATWTFARSGAAWSQQGPKLKLPQGGAFGVSVALSADGNTALIGAGADELSGAAWVFTRSGSTWAQPGEELTPAVIEGVPEGTPLHAFGASVALSGDGTTALVGAPLDAKAAGAAWAYRRSGSSWVQQGPKLTGSAEGGEGWFGQSVALSSSGNNALIGGVFDSEAVGAAWTFLRTGSTWSPQGLELSGCEAAPGRCEESGNGAFGASVALSSSAETALIGGPEDAGKLGAAWAFFNPTPNTPEQFIPAHSSLQLQALGAGRTPRVFLSHLTQSHDRWREGSRAARFSRVERARGRAPLGTTFSFVLNEPARVTFLFTHRTKGQLVKRRCVAHARVNHHNHACKGTVTAAAMSFSGHAGTNKVSFQGRVSPNKILTPGGYTLVVTASTVSGHTVPNHLSFTIVK
jgi:hypothetical protein